MKVLITQAEFRAEFGGPGKTKFYELINSHQLRAVKVGRRTFVHRDEAEAWARSLPAYQPKGR